MIRNVTNEQKQGDGEFLFRGKTDAVKAGGEERIGEKKREGRQDGPTCPTVS